MKKIIKLLEVAEELVKEELKKEVNGEKVNQYLLAAQCDIGRAIEAMVDCEQDKKK